MKTIQRLLACALITAALAAPAWAGQQDTPGRNGDIETPGAIKSSSQQNQAVYAGGEAAVATDEKGETVSPAFEIGLHITQLLLSIC